MLSDYSAVRYQARRRVTPKKELQSSDPIEYHVDIYD
jgi:hypothetical protein